MAEAVPPKATLGTGALLSIGIGGMVGGGIFAITGLTIELTHGAAPMAFAIAGLVALLTAYSYLKLSLRYPSVGGTVEFLNRAFGPGVLTGALSILLCLSYVILLAIYAYAFGSYGAELTGGGHTALYGLASGILIMLGVLNLLGPHLVIRSENSFNVIKMLLLAAFVGVGLLLPGDWSRLAPQHWVAPLPLFAGAMVIFLNYEGFELIANAVPQAGNPKRSLPIAYLGGTAMVLLFYVAIVSVVLLHASFADIALHRDSVLSISARFMAGSSGSIAIVIAALTATASAINATLYGSGRLTYLIAKYGELPETFEKNIRNQPLEGMIVFVALALLIVNLIPLAAIATIGSAGFLLVFAAVNLANLKLARETGARRSLAATGLLACVLAFAALCIQVLSNAQTRWQLLILAGMILLALLAELIYRKLSGRSVHMGRQHASARNGTKTRDVGLIQDSTD